MKITRNQLRQIIQEELNTSLAEGKKKRKKGQPKDQYLYSTDVANSEDEVAKHDAWSGGDNLNNPADWQKVLDMIKEELSKAAPFGSGMKQAKLDKDQKKVVGHT